MLRYETLQNIPQTALDIYKPSKPDIQTKLYPTLEAIGRIYTGVLEVLDENNIKEEEILAYLDSPGLITPRQKISIDGRDLHRLAYQYEHIRKITGATMSLKKRFLEKGFSDRIVAYQTGTGWPLPKTIEGKCEEVDFIHYGKEELSEFSPPGSISDKEAGMHVYKLTDDKNNETTLLVLKGRMHGYTETSSETAPMDLAFMPRVLKGLGTEFVLSTFASGADKLIAGKNNINKHDLGVVVAASSVSGLSSIIGPGSGDTRITAKIFGGAFQNIAAMIPKITDIQMFIDTVKAVNKTDPPETPIRPRVVPAVQVDTGHEPNFQGPYEQAEPHLVFDRIIKNNTLPPHLMKLFPNKIFEKVKKYNKLTSKLMILFPPTRPVLVHGMVQISERDADFQSWSGAITSPFNRQLRELAIETFTDMLDLGVHGQSHDISDEAVKRSAREAESIMAKIITEFFQRYINTPEPVET